ncbi:MAG: GAP family protein [Patescibacteria group bacterium]
MSLQNLILNIFPLALAAAISPTVLAITIVTLSSGNYAKKRVVAFLIGAAFVTITFGTLEILAAGELTTSGEEIYSPISSYIDLGLGIFLLLWGIKKILKPGKKKKGRSSQGNKTPQISWFLLLGGFSMATNFSTFIFYLAALKTISLDTNTFLSRLIALLFINFFILLPVTIPVFITILAPKSSKRLLEKANVFLEKHGNDVTITVLMIIGIYLIVKALKVLI